MNKKYVECDCGCSILSFESEVFDEQIGEEIYIYHHIPSYYANQNPIWNRLREVVKMIWYILRGKDYNLYEIILTGNNVIKFKKEMTEFLNG